MKSHCLKTTLFLFTIVLIFTSCSSKNEGANSLLESARIALAQNDFQSAKNNLDSIKILYPKAFEQQHMAFALLDTVRRAENDFIMQQCDSLISRLIPQVDSMKTLFHYSIDKNYQEAGVFVPKMVWNNGQLQFNTLRPGVAENGELYIESIYIGSQIHDQIKASTKEGNSAESLTVNDDGLNFRFTNLGKQYEIIKFTGSALNGIADFIITNQEKAITLTLTGNSKYSYQIPANTKKAISQSVDLSVTMLQLDSLKEEKKKAEFRNYKLTEKANKTNNQM